MTILKKTINFLIKKFNFKNETIINLRDYELNVESISNLKSQKNAVILLNIPIEKCITAVYWDLKSYNPFINSIKSNDYQILRDYYKENIPNNIRNLLHLEEDNKIGDLSAYSYVFPWQSHSPKDRLKQREKITAQENAAYGGFNIDLVSYGHTDFGPVSDLKFKLEVERISSLAKSIKENGYLENIVNDSCINGYFLFNSESDWRFYITGGKHRAYVLTALNYISIPVVIRNVTIINIAEYKNWHHYKNGNFSYSEIRGIFKNFFKN